MSGREEFVELFKEKITRPGADALLNFLEHKSDFFVAPASARYHLACEGGLCEHSLNVYHCLVDYLQRERVQELYGLEYSEETVAVVALLHDLCKIGCYKKGFRNVKNDTTGQWEKVPTYTFEDPLPYGHGEKSVYIANGLDPDIQLVGVLQHKLQVHLRLAPLLPLVIVDRQRHMGPHLFPQTARTVQILLEQRFQLRRRGLHQGEGAPLVQHPVHQGPLLAAHLRL